MEKVYETEIGTKKESYLGNLLLYLVYITN